MKYYRKERDFFFGILNNNEIERYYWDGINGRHIELPTFTVKVSAYTQWRHLGNAKVVKDKTFLFWKPTLESVSNHNGNFIRIKITSSNHLEMLLEMSRNKQGDWFGNAYIYNHNKMWRWSEHKNSKGMITETFCDDFMKYFLYRMEIL